ncbi:MAG: DDE transposase family protein, partial [Bacillus sp. (in: Bacteria)]|nr:DDE transposase family protein [Bacillus sp. (in: firmicutes)]
EIEEILGKTVRNLIHKKKFKRMIADGCYVVAVDGTQKWSTDWEFNARALRKKHGNTTTYHVYVLEAALVGPQGIAIPLMSEFCENPFDNSEQKKQDCERKAFYRLSVRLKSLFPKQPLMIVADGLYPNGPVMATCRINKWDFMIVLPNQVCLSSVWQEAKAIFSLEPEQKLINQWGDRTQNFKWANQIKYEWRDREGKRHYIVLHMVYCHETWQRDGETKESTWAWVSAKAINKKNVLERCNGAARYRWNIEEQILTEKKGGYNYEHMFSFNWNGMKCWHSLMHLGHLLNILTLHTVDLWETVKKRGINGTIHFLRQTLTGRWVDIAKLAALPVKPQLRLVI